MITLTAKISPKSTNSSQISNLSASGSKNNVSAEIGDVLGKKTTQDNPFIIGASSLGDGATFLGKSRSYISFASNIIITIKGNVSNGLVIVFDTLNNRHPKNIYINSKTYLVDSAVFKVEGLPQTTNYIRIPNWNTPNYPKVISGIYLPQEDIYINLSNIISLNGNINYRSDNKLPSYGILSNSGKLEANDNDNSVLELAEKQELTSDMDIVVELNNTLAKISVDVGHFKTKEWEYDNDNRSFSVSLKDDLVEWQDIQVKGINFDPRNPYAVLPNGTMADLYKWLHSTERTPQKYEMLSFEELDAKTQEILNSTSTKYPLLEDGTLWEQWTKLCEVCGLYIYKNNNGKTVCSYVYGG